MIGGKGQQLGDDTSAKQLEFDTTYIFKLRVETVADYQACDPDDAGNPRRTCYRFKVWEQGTAEPATWDLVGLGNFGQPDSGSVVLVAHHVDATFGDVIITNVEPITDSFNRCEIDDTLWSDSLPAGASVAASGYTAEILAKAGMSHNTGSGGNTVTLVPHLSQRTNDIDFAVEARFNSTVDVDGQQQGFLIEEDANDFVRIAFLREGSTVRLRAHSFSSGNASSKLNAAIAAGTPSYLRVTRTDDQWQVDYSLDGSNYVDAGTFSHGLAAVRISLFAGSSGATDHMAKVDYLHNRDSSTDPTDTVAVTFDRVLAGRDPFTGGSVTGAPQSPTPGNTNCGSPLQLTATPSAGWSFDRWEGVFGAGEDAVIVREFGMNEVITAHFVQGAYVLKTNVQSNGVGLGGAVQRSPDKPQYPYNEVVQLQAVPNPGWQFSNWNGDLNGSIATQNLTMTENRSVTAVFAQEKYALDVTISDQGGGDASANKVNVAPPTTNPPGYIYNESTTLTAEPALGWRFTGWSGDLSGAQPSSSLTFTGDAAVTATFAQDYFSVAMETVDESGQPLTDATINLTPPLHGAGYELGERAIATALPPTGWNFMRWEGALTGMSNPATLTVDGNATLRAVFKQPAPNTYFLADSVQGGQGIVMREPPGPDYGPGESVTITAEAADGWVFVSWQGDVTADDVNKAQIVVVMNADKTVTATFMEEPIGPKIYLPLLSTP